LNVEFYPVITFLPDIVYAIVCGDVAIIVNKFVELGQRHVAAWTDWVTNLNSSLKMFKGTSLLTT